MTPYFWQWGDRISDVPTKYLCNSIVPPPTFTMQMKPMEREREADLNDIHVLMKNYIARVFPTRSQCSTIGLTKAVVCIILSVGWCI